MFEWRDALSTESASNWKPLCNVALQPQRRRPFKVQWSERLKP
jgi:hypothetical protein